MYKILKLVIDSRFAIKQKFYNQFKSSIIILDIIWNLVIYMKAGNKNHAESFEMHLETTWITIHKPQV